MLLPATQSVEIDSALPENGTNPVRVEENVILAQLQMKYDVAVLLMSLLLVYCAFIMILLIVRKRRRLEYY